MYTVTVTNDGNGTASASPASGVSGTEVTLTATPNAGYQFKEWQVVSGGVTVSNNKFTIGTANVEIKAVFEAIVYSVTVTDDGNGTASASPASGVSGTEVTLTATPNAGYQFKEWQVVSGGVTVSDNKFTIGTANVEVKAVFEAIVYTVTVTDDGNGTASASPTSGTIGTEVALTATPNAGYQFKEWQVVSGGVTVSNNKFTIGTENVEIKAVFEAIVYTVTVTDDGNGTASASPDSGIIGTEVTLTATPKPGYRLKEWKVVSGGVKIEDDKFTIGTANVEIKAIFEKSPKHYLTINYVLDDGKKAADAYLATLREGVSYEVESPKVGGYTPDQATVSGVMGKEDVNIIVTYNGNPKHYLTINYVFEDGTKAADAYLDIRREGEEFTVKSPEIPNYVADRKKVSDVMGAEDYTAIVTYTSTRKDEVTANGGVYTLNHEKLTATFIKPVKKTATTLKVNASVKANKQTYKVTAVADGACKGMSKLTTLTIGGSVTTIGKNAFADCGSLKTVKGGAKLKTIGASAFAGCAKLTSVATLKKLKTIGESAFKGCKALAKFTLAEQVATIGKNAFNGCAKLKTIVIKTKLLKAGTVGSNAFKGIYAKPAVSCPKGMVKTYRTLLLKKGMPRGATFK